MKKILVIGLIFILIGGIFCGAAYATGEKYADSELADIRFAFAANSVDKINIGNYIAEIKIIKGELNSSEILVTAENVEGEVFVCGQSGGILSISYDPEKLKFGFFHFPTFVFEPFWNNRYPVIKIYIPEEKLFDEIYIEGGLGDTEIAHIEVKSFVIKGGVGNYNIKSIYAEKLYIEGGLGDLKINGEIAGDIKIDGGVGNVRLNLKGDAEDYSVNSNNGIGNIKINGKSRPWGDNWYRGIYKIDIDGGLGDVNISIN
jgi:hypothetical protein